MPHAAKCKGLCLLAVFAMAPAQAAPKFTLAWPLRGSPLAPGLQFGATPFSAWKATGSKLAPGETAKVTASGILITCTAATNYDCGIGTNFPLRAGTPYVVTVNVQFSTLVGTAGVILDNYPDVYVSPNRIVTTNDDGAVVNIGTAQPDAGGWITLGLVSDGKVFSAGFGTPETGLAWTPLSTPMRTSKSVNFFVSTEELTLPATGSGLFADFLITNP